MGVGDEVSVSGNSIGEPVIIQLNGVEQICSRKKPALVIQDSQDNNRTS